MSAKDVHPNLKQLRNSGSETLNKCARKFQLNAMLGKDSNAWDDEHLNFGDILGRCTQEYLITGSRDRAFMLAFTAWKEDIDFDYETKSKKNFPHILHAIDKFISFRATVLAEYDLFYLNDAPCIELGILVDCGDGFTYRMHLDALLIHKIRRTLAVYEGKTTKFTKVDEAVYGNSGQALGYQLVIDTLVKRYDLKAQSAYDVLYPVYKTGSYDWEMFAFRKSLSDKARWIRNLIIDKKHIIEYSDAEYFPMRGYNCFDYFKVCPWFGTCDMSDKVLLAGVIEDKVEDPADYQFVFTLDQLIEDQLKELEG